MHNWNRSDVVISPSLFILLRFIVLNLFDWDVVNRWGKQRFVLWIHRCRKLWSHEFVLLRSVLKCIV